VIRTLPRVVPADPGKPVRDGARSTQLTSRAIAEDPATWSPRMARETVETFTRLAGAWEAQRGSYRPIPLADALARGGPMPGGLCLEVGSGTGLLTPLLASVWPRVLCLDLTPAMLRHSSAPWRVLADAARLPVGDAQAGAVVLADVPLFARELVRVLAPAGVVVWSNALGTDAPHHVPVETVLAALNRASAEGGWSAVTAHAGWGLWAVFRRERGSRRPESAAPLSPR
jgi:SAM-dependent methyltransferase